LLLQGLASLFRLEQGGLAFAQGLAIGLEPLLRLQYLSRPCFQLLNYFLLLCRRLLDDAGTFLQLMLFEIELILHQAKLAHRRFKSGAPLIDLQTFLLAKALVALQVELLLLGVLMALLHVGFRGMQPGLLLGDLLLVPAKLLTHPLQARAEAREHRLLPFEGGGTLRQLRVGGFLFGLLSSKLLGFAAQLIVPLVQFLGLSFDLPAGALQLLGTLIDLAGPRLELLLALFHRSLEAIEPDEIGLILGLLRLQGGALLVEVLFSRLVIRAHLGQRFLLAGEQSFLLLQELTASLQLGGLGVQLRTSGRFFLLAGLAALDLPIDLALILLHLAGGPVDGLVQAGQAIATLAITVVKLLADVGQLLADGCKLLLLFPELLRRGLDLALSLRQFLSALGQLLVDRGRLRRGSLLGQHLHLALALLLDLFTAPVPNDPIGFQLLSLFIELLLADA